MNLRRLFREFVVNIPKYKPTSTITSARTEILKAVFINIPKMKLIRTALKIAFGNPYRFHCGET
jgi:hypothetical protein